MLHVLSGSRTRKALNIASQSFSETSYQSTTLLLKNKIGCSYDYPVCDSQLWSVLRLWSVLNTDDRSSAIRFFLVPAIKYADGNTADRGQPKLLLRVIMTPDTSRA